MSNVYWIKTGDQAPAAEVSAAARRLLEVLTEREGASLEREIPLKVHFGERGNETWVRPDCFDGIIDLLEERGVKSSFMETSVLYGGPPRQTRITRTAGPRARLHAAACGDRRRRGGGVVRGSSD